MMKNRVYGLVGVKAIRNNWNADFTGRPRTAANGDIVASDKALKYSERKYWFNNGANVFSFSKLNDNLNPMSLKEKYEDMFTPLAEVKNIEEVILNLFSCVDIMNFGVTFAEAGFNINATGAVQIQQGINFYDDVEIETLGILSPFRNPNNKKDGSEKTQKTNGEIALTDKAQYIYPFSVNPQNYNEFSVIKDFVGYSEDAYNQFKEATRLGATALNTNTKAGCENDFALFVELKDNAKTYLPSLINYISYVPATDRTSKDQYDFTKIFDLLEDIKEDIKTIEIYYNQYITNIIIPPMKDINIKRLNILNSKPIK